MKLTVPRGLLRQNSSHSNIWRIHFNYEGQLWIGEGQDGCRGESSLEQLKCLISPFGPLELPWGLLGKGCKGFCNGAEIPYKSPIKICKTKKALYLSDRTRLGPVQDCMGLSRIHLDAAIGNNEPKGGDSWYMKHISPPSQRGFSLTVETKPAGHAGHDLGNNGRRLRCHQDKQTQTG